MAELSDRPRRIVTAFAQMTAGRRDSDDAWLDVRLALDRWISAPTDAHREQLGTAFDAANRHSDRMTALIAEVLDAGGDDIDPDTRAMLEQQRDQGVMVTRTIGAVVAYVLRTGRLPVDNEHGPDDVGAGPGPSAPDEPRGPRP